MKLNTLLDIPNEEYHAMEGISSSQIKDYVTKAPAYFKAKYIDKVLKPFSSDAFAVGTAVHTMFLEPEKAQDDIAVMPEINKRTKQGKLDYQRFSDCNVDKTIVTQPQYNEILLMNESLNANPAILNTRTDSQFEKSIFVKDAETGLLLKVRPDILHARFIGDLKTAQSASLRGFTSAVRRYGYHISAAMYLDVMRQAGYEPEAFLFPVVEKEAPYLSAIYVLSAEMLEEGHEKYREGVVGIADSMATDVWEGYNNNEVMEIS